MRHQVITLSGAPAQLLCGLTERLQADGLSINRGGTISALIAESLIEKTQVLPSRITSRTELHGAYGIDADTHIDRISVRVRARAMELLELIAGRAGIKIQDAARGLIADALITEGERIIPAKRYPDIEVLEADSGIGGLAEMVRSIADGSPVVTAPRKPGKPEVKAMPEPEVSAPQPVEPKASTPEPVIATAPAADGVERVTDHHNVGDF